MENLYLKESPLTPITRKMQNFMLTEAFVVNFVVDPIPKIEVPEVRDMFHQMINELESIPNYGMGSKGSNLWTKDYEHASEFLPTEEEDIWAPVNMLKNYYLLSMNMNNIHTR